MKGWWGFDADHCVILVLTLLLTACRVDVTAVHTVYTIMLRFSFTSPFLHPLPPCILNAAAITYSRGDNERLRRQLEAEAALIFADMPPGGGWSSRAPSVTGSLAGSAYRFTANMDIDSAAFLRSSQGPFGRSVYGVTPTASNASPLRRRDSECSLSQRSTASAGMLAGASPQQADDVGLVQPPCGDGDMSRGVDGTSV
jgi:hypothetical protein